MTDYILNHINIVKQLSLLSNAYLKRMIKLNISKELDRKQLRKKYYLTLKEVIVSNE